MKKKQNIKKTIFVLSCMFVFFYVLNFLTPMAFGDDYVYSFVWQGHSEFEPLTESATRISSLHDLFVSQLSHYYTWSGRTVSHTIAQILLWAGKDVFNFFNALISVILIVEIYWCANKGAITLGFKSRRLCWIFFVLWAFTPGFSPVFFWLSGSCNYLWTAVLLLAFLIPFIRKYYSFNEKYANNVWFKYVMFFSGLIAGWTNENSICWIILSLFVFIYFNLRRRGIESWMFFGIAGLITGYALLMLAPGNVARLHAEVNVSTGWFTAALLQERVMILAGVSFFQFILWYFNLRSLFVLQKIEKQSNVVNQDRVLIIILCLISMCMTSMMLFSPNFPPRSSFPGTVQLIIAGCILLRTEEEHAFEIINRNAKMFLSVVGSVYFIVSVTATFYGFFDYHIQVQNLLSFIKESEQTKERVITVRSLVPVSEAIANASGLHLLFFEMSEDEKDWRNVSFARYYGIKGIRMIEKAR